MSQTISTLTKVKYAVDIENGNVEEDNEVKIESTDQKKEDDPKDHPPGEKEEAEEEEEEGEEIEFDDLDIVLTVEESIDYYHNHMDQINELVEDINKKLEIDNIDSNEKNNLVMKKLKLLSGLERCHHVLNVLHKTEELERVENSSEGKNDSSVVTHQIKRDYHITGRPLFLDEDKPRIEILDRSVEIKDRVLINDRQKMRILKRREVRKKVEKQFSELKKEGKSEKKTEKKSGNGISKNKARKMEGEWNKKDRLILDAAKNEVLKKI